MASPTTTYTNPVAAARTNSVENVLPWPSQPKRWKFLTLSPQLRAVAKAIPVGEILDVASLVAFLFLLCMVRV
jgi:hypothetical protein